MSGPGGVWLLAGAALAAVVAGVFGWMAISRESVVVYGEEGATSQVVPDETLTDWVSYADQVSVFEVVSEQALPLGEHERRTGEGYIGRSVTLRIEGTIWRRPGAPSAAESVRVVTWGWALHDGDRRLAGPMGGPRLEVGERFVAPLVRLFFDGRYEWTPFPDGSIFPLEGDRIVADGIVGGEPSPLLEQFAESRLAELADQLADTPPDPLAVKYAHLDPEARYVAVYREREGR